MKTALAQIGMAGARYGDDRLIADDNGLERRATTDSSLVAKRNYRGNRNYAGMNRTLPIAVIQFDAMAGGASDISRIEQIGAALAAGHRNPASGANPGQYGFGTAREITTRSGDNHAKRIEEVSLGRMPYITVKRIPFQVLHQS